MQRSLSLLWIVPLFLSLLAPLLTIGASGQAATTAPGAQGGDALPPGFIAVSESRMDWQEANAYCQKQGGRLPRINNSAAWDGAETAGPDPVGIEAFGVLGGDWPALLPKAYYWTGTQDDTEPGYSWGVRAVQDGIIGVIGADAEGNHLRVACIR